MIVETFWKVYETAGRGLRGWQCAITPGMVRAFALLMVIALAVSPAAWARQPIFSLSVVSPNGDSTAYSVAIAPLGRNCGPLDMAGYRCLYPVDAGQQLTLTLTLAPGYSVTQWSALCSGTGLTAVATIPADAVSGCGLTLGYDPKLAVNGWWWVPDEPGRGYSLALNDQGRIFIAAYGYDETGAPHWRSGTLSRVDSGTNLTIYRGTIAEHRGGGTLFGGEAGSVARTGRQWAATFAMSSRGGLVSFLSLADNVDGTIVTKRIQRYPIGGPAVSPAPANAAATGWYYDATQPGVGYFVEQQGGQAFLSAFAYDSAGAPVWYVMGAPPVPTGDGYLMEAEVNAYRGGSPFSAAPPLATASPVPAGQVSARLGKSGVWLRLSNGRTIPLAPFAW